MKPTSIKIHPQPNDSNEPLKQEIGQLSVDIYKTANELVILAPIAGINKDDIKLSITNDVLVIQGERPLREAVAEENYYTQECFWGNFSRAIVLPEEADSKNVSASFDNNVLEIRIPKGETKQTKIIKIEA